MCKLQFLITTHNLLTKFHMEVDRWRHQLDYVTLSYKRFLDHKLHIDTLTINYSSDQSDDIIYCLLLLRAITGRSLNFIPYPPSTKHELKLHGFFPPTNRGSLIQKNQNFVVGSKFSNYVCGEVAMGWEHVKVLFREEVLWCFWEYLFFENFWKKTYKMVFRRFHFNKVIGQKVT